MTPIVLFFDHSPDGKYFPQSRLTAEFCDLVGKPYLTSRQIAILQKNMLFRIDTDSLDREVMRKVAAYRRPRITERRTQP